LLVHIKPKPQEYKNVFRENHADSLWQGDTFQFRIKNESKVQVTGFIDDCSRERIVSKAYLRKDKEEAINALGWALHKGRIPKAIYLNNGKQFIAKLFKQESEEVWHQTYFW
jgi:transposase InsO family protein